MKWYIKKEEFKKVLSEKLLTQKEFADRICTHKKYLNDLVNNLIPTGTKTVKKICRSLKKKPTELFELREVE